MRMTAKAPACKVPSPYSRAVGHCTKLHSMILTIDAGGAETQHAQRPTCPM